MKYGLLVVKDTENIGDDIQAYAARQFLPQVIIMWIVSIWIPLCLMI